jgi:hypothetical protein
MSNIKMFSILLALISTSLFADENTEGEDTTYTTRSTLMAITEKNVHRTLGGKNPAHLRSNGPFITADFLYWKAGIDGLEIATRNRINTTSTFLRTKELNLNAEWRPGLRLGFGWLFGNYDQWDLHANWTCFYDKATIRRGSRTSLVQTYTPSWSPILGPLVTRIHGAWNLHYNVLDLSVGRNYFISRKVALRPHVGLRGVWINLDYQAHYTSTLTALTSPSNDATSASSTAFKATNDFEGIGVRSGADLMWHFSNHFGISSKFSAALLYGHFDVDETFYGINLADGIPLNPLTEKYSNNLDRVRVNIEAFLGLFFETRLANGKYHFTLHAGYELSEWFQQNQLSAFNFSADTGSAIFLIPTGKDGDLGLQGLTISACFNF